ncbi:MAG: LPS assembly lipoprotein LptE [Phycisphaerae bacterium]
MNLSAEIGPGRRAGNQNAQCQPVQLSAALACASRSDVRRAIPREPLRVRACAPLATIAVACLCGGCGYSTDKLFRSDVQTVYVEMFTTKEFRRDLEFGLTEAVKKRIATDTPYRLAPREKADTILKGEVLEERQAAFAPDFRSRLPRDKQLTLAVRVQWQDVRSGKVLLDQPVLLQAVDYSPPTGETEKYAQQKATDRLAARIVAKMYDDW